jgi:uracil-DNA glycosylase family protein
VTSRPERPGAEAWVPADPTLDDLAEAVQGCQGCELYRDATQAVMGQGSATAKVILLGEQPGEREDVEGEPFVGPAGKLLAKALGDAAIDQTQVYRTNAVKHFRWSGTRGKQRIHKNPSQVHIAACGPWMVAELDLVRPEGLVLLGATAGKAVYGASFRVGEARGRLAEFPPELPGHHQPTQAPGWVLATTHPAAVLRSRERDADYERFVSDLRVAADALAAVG